MQAKAYLLRRLLATLAATGGLLFSLQCGAQAEDAPFFTNDVSAEAVEANTPDVRPSVLQTGVATYYARSFHGRRTANGERYDMDALSAAHRTLPFGSYVRVTNIAKNKSVIVRINDRGPFVQSRVIDLSFAAATLIGLQRAGSARVTIEPVSRAEARESKSAPATSLAQIATRPTPSTTPAADAKARNSPADPTH